MTQVFLTNASTSPWTVPGDFAAAGHTVELLGAGGNGGNASTGTGGNGAAGGGGGGYSGLQTYSSGSLGSSVAFAVPASCSSTSTAVVTCWQNTTATNCNTGNSGLAGVAASGSLACAGGAGGVTTASVGSPAVTYTASGAHAGGTAGSLASGGSFSGSGGGGAGGPTGVGAGSAAPTQTAAATGGGGANGGTASPTNNTTTGGAGGNGKGGSGGGAGGTAASNAGQGGAGAAGSGGGGGGGGLTATTVANTSGGNGAGDNNWDGTSTGAGGGGGGAGRATGNAANTCKGGNGGPYGGGGGGGGGNRGTAGTQAGGTGGGGLIAINYTPAAIAWSDSANFAGAGALTAAAGQVWQTNPASFFGSGALSAPAGQVWRTNPANFAGAGSLTAAWSAGATAWAGSASFAGQGALAAAWIVTPMQAHYRFRTDAGLVDGTPTWGAAQDAPYSPGGAPFRLRMSLGMPGPPQSYGFGLVGYWGLDSDCLDFYDALALDISGQGNNGVMTGLTAANEISGQVLQALVLDVTSSTIALPNVNYIDPTKPFTISCWAYCTALGGGVPLCSLWKMQSADGFYLWLKFDNQVGFAGICVAGGSDSTWAYFTNNAGVPVDTTWRMITLAYNGAGQSSIGNFRLYVNAALQTISASAAASGPRANTGFIGPAWNGGIDDFRIYNRALSQAEVTSLYNAGAAGQRQIVTTPNATGPFSLWCSYNGGAYFQVGPASSNIQSSSAGDAEADGTKIVIPRLTEPV